MKSLLYFGCPAFERADVQQVLASVDLSVVWIENLAHAVSELQRSELPVLLDLSAGQALLETARELRALRGSTLMFAVADARRPELTTEALLLGIADVFSRPLGARRVFNAIERERRYESRHGADAGGCDELYAQSPAMREVMQIVGRAASMRAGVLIRGERGTGRQALARAIHLSGHATGAFVTIDCAAIPGIAGIDDETLEARIFGSAACGSNSDQPRAPVDVEAVSRDGLLYEAAGGTLYLRNVGEASSRVQARLARALRDREAMLVETRQPVDLDVRPIAGVDLAFGGSAADSRMHDELLRRLSVVRIQMPPLRNRREDIPALANYFLREVCAARRLTPKTFSRPALSLISALPWRGNAIELRELLEVIVTSQQNGRGIGLEDVLALVKLDGGSATLSNTGTLRQARARFEREYIVSVLEQHQGRISDAARALGIQRTNLYRKMRSLRVAKIRAVTGSARIKGATS